eukprot:TRINITY_DN21940_c0_g1_i1.p1 TRINITY_DN21940_c0_g1~~TRINITY_DN21940_c0_g1_i1.p1  ORF type:complete len:313 (+),score=98.14 TRINITY_DN21940_c0_g1_i1:137-1075(+)
MCIRDRLHAVDRSGLLDDLFAMGVQRDSAMTLRQAMTLTHAIQGGEQEYVVWAPILKHLTWLLRRLSQSNCRDRLVVAASSVLTPLIERFGWEPQWHHEMAMLQAQALHTGLEFGLPELASQASTLVSSNTHLTAALLEVVYQGYAMHAGQDAYEHILQLYKQETVPSRGEQYLNAMASSNDPAVLLQLLELSVAEESPIKTAHLSSLFAAVAVSCRRIGQPTLLWQFLELNWAELEIQYGNSANQAMVLVIHSSQYLEGKEHYMTVARWLDKQGFQGTRVAKWALLNMRINSHFNRYLGNKKACLQWIEEQ